MTVEQIDGNSEISRSEEVVACELEGGAALLDMREGKYYKLNGTAALIWEWIENGKTVDNIVAKMLEKYDVDEVRCRQDVGTVISSFAEAGLLVSTSKKAV